MIAEPAPERRRIKSLDSLRGFAAVIVVFTHAITSTSDGNGIHYTPFYILKSAREAVLFFFLLSGYVLIYQYRNNPTYTYKRFLVQRFFRIYIPYISAVFLAISLSLLCIPIKGRPEWISGLWGAQLTIKIVIKHILGIGCFNTGAFNPVIWSLVHEMRMALLFPLLLYVVNLTKLKTVLVLALLTTVAVISIIFNVTYVMSYNDSYGYTAYYFYIFAIGGLIAKYQPYLFKWHSKLPAVKKGVLLIVSLLCYNYASLIAIILNDHGFNKLVNSAIITTVEDLIIVIASSYFIIAAISVSDTNIMCTKVPLYFGKVSYSLYLVHVPVLGFIYFILYGKIQTGLILCIGFLMSFLVAIVFNKYVEQGAKRVAKKMLLINKL